MAEALLEERKDGLSGARVVEVGGFLIVLTRSRLDYTRQAGRSADGLSPRRCLWLKRTRREGMNALSDSEWRR